MKSKNLICCMAALLGLAISAAAQAPAQCGNTSCSAASERDDDGRGTPFKVKKEDNICGLDEPRQLTRPAKVDYDALIDETPEAKTIKAKKIDPSSAKGIELMTKARSRVLTACESVRSMNSHCSVWKAISRRDGKAITDITDLVKAEISGDDD
jgi:hypothetical protein